MIDVHHLKFSLGDNAHFDFQDIQIKSGSICGIIGPNGSGKTSFVEAMLGLKGNVDSDVLIKGQKSDDFLADKNARKDMGVQLQQFAFSENVKVTEVVSFHKAIYEKQSIAIYEKLALEEISKKKISQLSGGQKQRVNLFLCLAHEPKLISLDEPSAALDKQFADRLMLILKDLKEAGSTILMVTHHPYELEICDDIFAVKDGKKHLLASKDVFINQHIGPMHAAIQLSQEQDDKLKVIYEKFESLSRYARIGDQLDLYGDEGLEAEFLQMVQDHQLSDYAFGRTNSDDIIKLMTKVEATS